MRSFRARLLAFLTAVAVLLPAGAFARTQFFCRMMGRTVPTCCCAKENARSARAATGEELRARGCCERISAAQRDVIPSTLESGPPVPEAAALAVVVPLIPLVAFEPTRLIAHVIRARAPPPLGPPLFIANCSLLS